MLFHFIVLFMECRYIISACLLHLFCMFPGGGVSTNNQYWDIHHCSTDAVSDVCQLS